MKRFLFLLIIGLMATAVQANNIPPVAVIDETPNRTWFYNAEEVAFSAQPSYDNDGYINYTKWYINGVFQTGGSYFYALNTCFVLYGSVTGDCYELPNGVTTVTIKLEVRDNHGNWDSETKTYTIKEHKGRKYFIKDHLGSVRTTVNRDGNVLGYDDYYPFGLVMPGRSSNSANPNDNYKFTGYEDDDEADLKTQHAGARRYDPIIGRFLSIDRFYDKYPSMSPYQYAANNPVNFIDVNGDSINVAKIQEYDINNGTDYLGTILKDLSAMTGLQFSVADNGQLVYAQDENGDAIVSTDKDGNQIGSGEARNRLKSSISTKRQAFATITSGSTSVPGTGSPLIRLNPTQIDQFVQGASPSVDSRTMGYGMTFMHEILHSNVGMVKSDGTITQKRTYGHTGPVVDTMNRIRLDLGHTFGQRLSYPSMPMKNGYYVPFDIGSFNDIERGILPAGSSKHIRY